MFKTSKIQALHDRKLLVIIGNGFDLDLELKTSYKDFMLSDTFKEYRKESHSQSNDPYSRLNLFDYLQDRFDGNNKRWIDIEIELRDYAKDIDLTEYDDKQKAIDYIEHSFNQVRDALYDYLSGIDYSVLNTKSAAIELLKAIRRGRNCVIYDFNYTDIGRLLTFIRGTSSFSVHYIHGTLKDRSIVIGFENIRLHYSHLDFMVKFKSDNYKTSTEFDIRTDLENAEEVLIFGHTLGSTDHSYFKHFFQKETNRSKDRLTPISIVTYNANSRRLILCEIDEMTNHNADILNINFIQTHGNTSQEEIHSFFENLSKRISPRINSSVLTKIKPPTIIPL